MDRPLFQAVWLTPRIPLLRALGRGVRRGLGSWANLIVLVIVEALFRAFSAASPRNAALAHAHASDLIQLERRLHIFVEPQVQHAVLTAGPLRINGVTLDGQTARTALSAIYAGGHLGWIAAILFWLYLFRRQHFIRVRNIAVLSTFLAIAFAALYPVAPPRFALAGPPSNVQDVTGGALSEQVIVQLSHSAPYSATPSGHTLWALLTGLGLFLGTKRRLGRVLAAGFPVVMVATVVLTGNHYFLDCLGSAVLLGACYAAQCLWERIQSSPTRPFFGAERRRGPNLRPMDYPLTLATVVAILMLVGPERTELPIGAVLLVGCALSLLVARRMVIAGSVLRTATPEAEWWCGFLFVAGATVVYASEPSLQLIGGTMWCAAAVLIVCAHLGIGWLAFLATDTSAQPILDPSHPAPIINREDHAQATAAHRS